MMNPANGSIGRACFLTVAALGIWVLPPAHALPTRLVLALDGVAYKDLQALQQGITGTNHWGRTFTRHAFTADEGYFPVSRMVSTFPSASDVAWTDIFGDRPLPGYQRTYYSAAAATRSAPGSWRNRPASVSVSLGAQCTSTQDSMPTTGSTTSLGPVMDEVTR